MIEKKKVVGVSENAVLVGLIQKDQTEQQVNEYLDELAFLAETAGAVTVKRFTQKMSHPDSKTFLGKGKLEEISNYISFKGNIDLVIFDDELTGAQIPSGVPVVIEEEKSSRGEGRGRGVEGVSAVQRVARSRRWRADLQEVHQHRLRGRHAERPRRAGNS